MPRHRLLRLAHAQAHRKVLRDVLNRLRFGADAPLSDELVWIDPQDVTSSFTRPRGARWKRRHSGLVKGGDWDMARRPLTAARKYRACVDHYVNGMSWEETGIVDQLLEQIASQGVYDGCRTRDDLLRRYERIDRMFDDLARTRRMEPASLRPEALRREHGGIFVHIARDGTPLQAGDGNHRIAIAQILKLETVPAHLGVLHRDALEADLLSGLRRGSSQPETGPGTP